jgi:alpha-1,3-mannosyl-glycoprotein beta-1,2-N-acetylglucosaminyltransferase
VCRTLHFGVRGTSNGEFSDFLTRIKLNDRPVAFERKDLRALLDPGAYEDAFLAAVRAAREVSPEEVRRLEGAGPGAGGPGGEARVSYGSLQEFEDVARRVGVMDNVKAGVPRAAYQGIVTFWAGDTKVYLAPREVVR